MVLAQAGRQLVFLMWILLILSVENEVIIMFLLFCLIPQVRETSFPQQKLLTGRIVMDGRDIGTVVLHLAELKFPIVDERQASL